MLAVVAVKADPVKVPLLSVTLTVVLALLIVNVVLPLALV